MAFIGIANGLVNGKLSAASDRCPELKTANVKDIECDLRSVAHVADKICHRDLCVSQNKRCRRRRPDAHLVFLVSGPTVLASFNDKRRKLLFLSVDLCEHDKDIGKSA